jgi:zinc and cadmium transporter
VPFAAGVLLTVALVGLVPEAVHGIGARAYGVVLWAFLGAFLFEHVFFGLHHHEEHPHAEVKEGSILLVILGDSIHNLVDGVAIGAAYLINPGLGLITAISTFLHEVPHEIGDFGLLLKAGWRRREIVLVNLASALMTLPGALAALWLSSTPVLGYLLAISAGVFLYLGASDFLPHATERKSKIQAAVGVLIGVVVMLVTLSAIPHTHESGGEHGDEEVEAEAYQPEDDH